MNTTPETNLPKLLASIQPYLNPDQYVFATVTDINSVPRELTICEFKEAEGFTVVISKDHADRLGLAYDYVAAWITLTVHSSLHAVGLTAAFSTQLAAAGISCNVIAGYYHDHIFVDVADKERAMEVLRSLAVESTDGIS